MPEPDTYRTVPVELEPDCRCGRCGKPLGRHSFTNLGAVRCLDLPATYGLARWDEHRFVTRAGEPYLAIMEQIGHLAGMVEERGLPEAREPAVALLDRIRVRLLAPTPSEIAHG
jgi:hypothetical protein